MMKVVPFKVEHLKQMIHQERNGGMDWLEISETFKSLEGEASYSIIDQDVVLVCAGTVCMHNGRGVAWAYIADGLSLRTMVGVTKCVKEYLTSAPFHRIEMHVDCDFEKAHNWARHLGFEMECERMKAFTPDKRDCALYAMVKL
jgi:hypothetical protein